MDVAQLTAESAPAPPGIARRVGAAARFPLACLLAVVTLIGFPWPASLTWHLRPVLFAGAVGLVVWDHVGRHRRPSKGSHQETYIIELPSDRPEALQRSASRGLDPEKDVVQCRAFLNGLLFPTEFRQRITERYVLNGVTLKQQTTLDMNVPAFLLGPDIDDVESAPTDRLYVPLLVPEKGAMLDDLRVFGADRAELPILTQHEYLLLAARTLRMLMVVAYGTRQLDPVRHWWALRAERVGLQAVMRRATEPGTGKAASEAILALCDGPPGAAPGIVHPDALRLAASMVRMLAERYAVVAVVPSTASGRFTVSYERLTIHGPSNAARGTFEFKLKPNLSVTTGSYHLIVDGPEGVYLFEQESPELKRYLDAHWERMQKESGSTAAADAIPPPYYRFGKRRGQRFAHFYTRFAPMPDTHVLDGGEVPEVRFRFRETPPGESFRAVLTAGSAALLIWLVGFVMSRGMSSNSHEFAISSDAPAILLVFPALAATWFGVEQRTQSLVARTAGNGFSIATTIVTSIAASGLFMVNSSTLNYLDGGNLADANLLGIHHFPWSLLTLIALLNAIVATYAHVGRSWQYHHLRSRPVTTRTEHVTLSDSHPA